MIQIFHVYSKVCSHTLIKQPYPTGHSEKSSLTLFHETPFGGERSGAMGKADDSKWLGGVVVVGVGSNPDGAQLLFLYFSTIHFFRMYLYQ